MEALRRDPLFVGFTEHNDWEGESWTFWIPIDGNEDEIDRLEEYFEELYESGTAGDPPFDDSFKLNERRRTRDEVQLLIDESAGDATYMSRHNLLEGVLKLPKDLPTNFEALCELFGKGGIRQLMKARAAKKKVKSKKP